MKSQWKMSQSLLPNPTLTKKSLNVVQTQVWIKKCAWNLTMKTLDRSHKTLRFRSLRSMPDWVSHRRIPREGYILWAIEGKHSDLINSHGSTTICSQNPIFWHAKSLPLLFRMNRVRGYLVTSLAHLHRAGPNQISLTFSQSLDQLWYPPD